MSKDLAPVDFIMLMDSTDFMEHPYITCVDKKGKIIGDNNRELCEKYPYVAFFTPLISDLYDRKKEQPSFHEKCALLNEQLKYIANKLMENKPNINEDLIPDKLEGAPLIDGLKPFFFAKNGSFDNQIKFVNGYFELNLNKVMYEYDIEK